MSDVKISALPVGVATSSTPFPAVVGGVTDQVTLAPVYTSLAGKAATSHTHAESDVTNLVSDLAGKAAASHTHAESDITNLVSDLSALATSIPAQCRLQVDSTTQISLQRYQGSQIAIKTGSTWGVMVIPSSGPTLANTGLTAATKYYIYAFNNSGTLALEASTTGHATDSDVGVEIKSGDATRTLVGMVFMDAGTPGTFVSSAVKRWCINWFNRSGLDMVNTYSADRSSSSTSFAELNSEIRLQFLTWADEAVFVCVEGSCQTDSSGQATVNGVDFDSTTTAAQAVSAIMTASQAQPYAVSVMKRLSEGNHIAHHNVGVSGGTASWTTADSIGTGKAKTRFWGLIRG